MDTRRSAVQVCSIVVLLVMMLMSVAACGSTSSGTSLGTVTLYTADGLEAYYKAVLPAFEKQYGAKVNMVTDGSGAVVNRLQVEKNSPKADVLVTLPPFVQQAEQGGLLTPFKSDADAHIAATRKDSQGVWYTFVDNYASWVYNPQLTPTPPATLDALLASTYKDQVAYSNPVSAGDGMAVIIELETTWGHQKTFDYLKALEPNVKFHTKGTGYLDVLVNRGEVHFANGDLQMDLSDKVQGGMTIQPTFLRPSANEAPVTFEDPYTISLTKGGPNSKGGQALINYLLSPSAQQQVWSVYGAPARDDITSNVSQAQQLQQALQGVRVLQVDWKLVIQDQDQWKQKWQQEVLNAYGKQGSVVAPK
jgi:2-aminoethylphosphonate transport system substrate-binding protein